MTFWINNLEWKIEYVYPQTPLLRRSDNSWTVGVTDRYTRTISISNALRGEFLRKVICHELCHASMFSYGVELSVEQEEIVADIIATYGREIIETTNLLFDVLSGVAA